LTASKASGGETARSTSLPGKIGMPTARSYCA
jgi:hypothetical protein